MQVIRVDCRGRGNPLKPSALNMTHFFIVFAKERSDCGKLPGGWRPTEYKFRTFSVGYFAALNMTYFFTFTFVSSKNKKIQVKVNPCFRILRKQGFIYIL
ncbi:MAG: hypothetical protein SO003_04975, partial [Candidatus Borkfalkiaceae bacterium]|nr:hypothetical protein [Christensenellaceae bacterium]